MSSGVTLACILEQYADECAHYAVVSIDFGLHIGDIMNEIRFIEQDCDHHFEYHLPTQYDGFLSNSIFYKTPLQVSEDECDDFFKFLWNSGISDSGSSENSLLYGKIVEKLNSNQHLLMVYFDNENAVEKIEGANSVEKSNWSYCLEFCESDSTARDFGLLSPKEFLYTVGYFNKDLSNRYFYIAKIDTQNIYQYKKMFNCDVTNWVFIITENEEKVRALLQQDKKPHINELLQVVDYLINIQIGEDEGYLDYVQIKTRNQRTSVIRKIENLLNDFSQQYDSALNDLGSIDSGDKVERYKKIIAEFVQS